MQYLKNKQMNNKYCVINNNKIYSEISKQTPLIIRQKNVDYLNYRHKLFEELYKEYPQSEKQIKEESMIDIPPSFRLNIYKVLLGLYNNSIDIHSNTIYNNLLNKVVVDTVLEHQLDLDIPRCHQYHPLLSSIEGHNKMRRIITTWSSVNTNQSYWQGLDSVLAPFLVLTNNNESLSFHLLQSFVDK